MSKALNAVTLGFWGLALAGCGEVGNNLDQPTPLANVSGTVTTTSNSGSVGTEKPIRVAVLWVGWAARMVAVEVPIKPEFPANFRLNLDAPPPQQVMVNEVEDEHGDFMPAEPGKFGFAQGIIVAYEDVNQNGMLDLVPRGAPAFIDKLLGFSETHLLFYSEGTPSQPEKLTNEFGGTVPRGYSLLRVDRASDESPFLGFVGTNQEVSLVLDPSIHEEWKNLMCEQFPNDAEIQSSSRTATELPASFPDADEVSCSADGRSFVHTTCEWVEKEELCSGYITPCEDVTYQLPSGTPPPAGYPCTVTP